jgi:hypothetical protein
MTNKNLSKENAARRFTGTGILKESVLAQRTNRLQHSEKGGQIG